MTKGAFPPRGGKADIEEGDTFAPKFDADGLIGAIAQDAGSGRVVMFAYMNQEALLKTIETGMAHYWSRSRKALWQKGETSGEVLRVREILTDCDQDVLLLTVDVEGRGAACHTGRKSCFYRKIDGAFSGPAAQIRLSPVDAERLFNPQDIYGKKAE